MAAKPPVPPAKVEPSILRRSFPSRRFRSAFGLIDEYRIPNVCGRIVKEDRTNGEESQNPAYTKNEADGSPLPSASWQGEKEE